MANKQAAAKVKGATFESDIVSYINEQAGAEVCERRPKHGNKDRGDILLYRQPNFVIECKAEKSFDLAGYCKELVVEVGNAGDHRGIIILKSPRKKIEDAYVIIPLKMFMEKWGLK